MALTTTTLTLESSGGNMEAYEARPKEGGPHAGIIVLMEAFGVNDHIKDVAERVANEGYVAVAPDLYHRETERIVPYSELQKAIGLMNRLQDSQAMDDVGAVMAHLKSQSYVKPPVGVMGFCMGGRLTYLSAAAHASDLKGAAVFYGGGIPMGDPSPLQRTREIACPMTLFFGGKDPLIPQEHVEQINKALTDAGKQFSLHVYPDATHGFFCNDRESYNASAASQAWEKAKEFFSKTLS